MCWHFVARKILLETNEHVVHNHVWSKVATSMHHTVLRPHLNLILKHTRCFCFNVHGRLVHSCQLYIYQLVLSGHDFENGGKAHVTFRVPELLNNIVGQEQSYLVRNLEKVHLENCLWLRLRALKTAGPQYQPKEYININSICCSCFSVLLDVLIR